MNENVTIISTRALEAFEPTFGLNAKPLSNFNPIKHYEPVIAQCSKLSVGPYYWFITDLVTGTAVDAGGAMEAICSVTREEYVGKSPEVLFRNSHPTDIVQMLTFSDFWIKYYSSMDVDRRPYVRPTIYIRQLNKSHQYSWVMVQFLESVTDINGAMIHSLTWVTDISQIKTDDTCCMTIFDGFDNTSHLYLCDSNQKIIESQSWLRKISKREIGVLKLLAIGLSSKQIASELDIAIKTVDNHRQNLLRKMSARSTGELVMMAVKRGLV